MKKLFSFIALFCLLSSPSFAGWPFVGGGPFNGNGLNGCTISPCPVQNGGTAQNYPGIQQTARLAYSNNLPIIPALYPNPPTVADSESIQITTNNFAPATGQASSFVTNSSTTSGNTLHFSSTFTVYMSVGSAITHVKPPGSVCIPSGAFIGTIPTSTTATIVDVNGNALNVTCTVNSGDNIAFGPVVMNRQGFYTGNSTNNLFFWRNFGGQQEGPQNITNGVNGNNANHANEISAIEFKYYGSGFVFDYDDEGGAAKTWIWVEGRPTTSDGVSPTGYVPAAGTRHFTYVNFNNPNDSAPRLRTVKIWMNGLTFYGIHYGNTETIAPTQQFLVTNYWLCDSYGEGGFTGTNVPSVFQTIPQLYAIKMNWAAPHIGCEGGTGWTTGGVNGTAYTDSGRVSNMIAINDNVVIPLGSINDANGTGVQTAVASVLASLKAAAPNTPVMFFGVQSLGSYTNLTASNIANNAAVKAAAAAAGDFYASPIDENWITGLGNVASTTGSGNGDVFMTTSGVHYTSSGGEYETNRYVDDTQNVY